MRKPEDEIEGVEGVAGLKDIVESTAMRNDIVAVLVEDDVLINTEGEAFHVSSGEITIYANGVMDAREGELEEIDDLALARVISMGGTVYNMEDI